MWRTVYKLTKTFNDQPGPRNVANLAKRNIDAFKEHLPLLNTICNPGIRDRHWQQVGLSPVELVLLNLSYETETETSCKIKLGIFQGNFSTCNKNKREMIDIKFHCIYDEKLRM
jgi:dynein heavy chain